MTLDWHTNPSRNEEWAAKQLVENGGELDEEEFGQEHRCKILALRRGRIFFAKREVVEYHDSHPDWERIGATARSNYPIVGAWDFGSGGSLLRASFSLVETHDETPVIWIDAELTWQQTAWQVAAADALEVAGGYIAAGPGVRRGHLHFGDPAGIAAESGPSSWQSNLRRAGGVPLFCLPGKDNTREQIEWAIKMGQAMLADGRIGIHRRCIYLWECIENWRRDAPDGVNLDYLSRTYVGPRHDVYSHGGMAFLYLIMGVHRGLEGSARQRPVHPEGERHEEGPAEQRIVGDRPHLEAKPGPRRRPQ